MAAKRAVKKLKNNNTICLGGGGPKSKGENFHLFGSDWLP